MAQENIEIQVQANTGQAQTNINNLDKTIESLIQSIQELNQTMISNIDASTKMGKGIDVLKTSVDKNTSGLSQLSGVMSKLGGDLGAAGAGVISLGQQLLILADNPVALTIIAIVGALELLKDAFTDTTKGQDEFDGYMAIGKRILNDLKEAVFDVVRGLVSLGQVMIDVFKGNWAKVVDDWNKSMKSFSGTVDEFNNINSKSNQTLIDATIAQNNFDRAVTTTKDSMENLKDKTKQVQLLISDLTYDATASAQAILSMRDATSKTTDAWKNAYAASRSYITKQSQVVKDLITGLDPLMFQQSTDIDKYMQNNLNLTKDQKVALINLQNAFKTTNELEKELLGVQRAGNKAEKLNTQRRIANDKEEEKSYTDLVQSKLDNDKYLEETQIDGSKKQLELKKNTINDEIDLYDDRNKELEQKIIDLRAFNKKYNLDPEEKQIKTLIHQQEVYNNKITLLKGKELLLIRKLNNEKIKSDSDLLIAEDEFALLSEKNDEKRYKIRKDITDTEMKEKLQITGLSIYQIEQLKSESFRKELEQTGELTGEQLKLYTDYQLKLQKLDEDEEKRKQEQLKKEKDFIKEGIKSELEEKTKYIDWDLSQRDNYKKQVQQEADDEIEIIKNKEKKLIDQAGEDIDLKTKIANSAAEQIKLIETNLYEERHKLWDDWVDSQVKGYDSVMGAVDEWNKALKGSANVSKGIEEAQAVINTLGAANKALNAKYSPEGTTDMVMRIAAVSATLAAGYAQVKKISETPSGGGGGNTSIPSMPSAPSMFALGQGQIQNPAAFANNRVYVTENDITTTQQRVKTVESASILGG